MNAPTDAAGAARSGTAPPGRTHPGRTHAGPAGPGVGWARAAWSGAVAGTVGGVVFGAAMVHLGVLPTVASLVRADSAVTGFAVHLAIAAVLGAGFGLLVRNQRPGTDGTLLWGLAYGALWWFLGALTLLPLFLGRPLAWDAGSAGDRLPSLFGHLLYGAATALVLVVLRTRQQRANAPDGIVGAPDGATQTAGAAGVAAGGHRVTVGVAVRGVLAGLAGAWLLGAALDAQGRLAGLTATMAGRPAESGAWWAVLLAGVLAGLGYALLHPRPADGAGPALVRGTAYGFLWWVVGGLTLMPLAAGSGLAWSVDAVQARFVTLPGFLLFLGAAPALLHHGLTALTRALFSADPTDRTREGVGAQGMRAVGRGALGGLVGGSVFTLVMVQIGFLPTVAGLVGATSVATGLVVHLLIANVLGAAYGLLFRRQSYDAGAALGWGMSYGVVWWLLGPLTVMPLLLGSPPRWTAEATAAAFPSLIGHLAYGAALGLVFYRLERRHNPWWVTRNEAEARRAADHREQVLTSAPAVWVLMVLVAVTIPILLGR